MESNERRYRPLNYTAHVAPSSSTTNAENRQFATSPPAPDLANPYYRRRTADNFPGSATVHSDPTVARSTLTASVSTNDMSKQPPKLGRPRFPLFKRFTPTRIPSPVRDTKHNGRHVSTPVLPSQKRQKENMQYKTQGPQKSKRSIPTPDRPAPLLPKSQTMGMLSNFTTSLSRPNFNLSDNRQAFASTTHPADVTASDPNYIPLPLFTPNTHQIHTSKINSYWCGRFQALCDRFQDEHLLMNKEAVEQYDTDDSLSPPSTPSPVTKGMDSFRSKSAEEHDVRSMTSGKKDAEQDKRSSRAFLHLQSLCTTNEARRSLWEFQLHFARIKGKSHLLPNGGKMMDDRGSWFGRVGRAMVGGNNTGSGLRSSLGMGKRKNSMITFRNA